MSTSDDTTVQPDPVHGAEAVRFGGWDWQDPRHGEHFRRCSYCGSVHPDDLAQESVSAEWADQKYGWPHKFYAHIPNRTPDALFVIGSSSHPAEGFLAAGDLTAEQEAVMVREGYGPDSRYRPQYVRFGTRAEHFGKFYSVHLADPAISDDTKAAIERMSGLHFEFENGRISWRSAIAPA